MSHTNPLNIWFKYRCYSFAILTTQAIIYFLVEAFSQLIYALPGWEEWAKEGIAIRRGLAILMALGFGIVFFFDQKILHLYQQNYQRKLARYLSQLRWLYDHSEKCFLPHSYQFNPYEFQGIQAADVVLNNVLIDLKQSREKFWQLETQVNFGEATEKANAEVEVITTEILFEQEARLWAKYLSQPYVTQRLELARQHDKSALIPTLKVTGIEHTARYYVNLANTIKELVTKAKIGEEIASIQAERITGE